MVTRTRLPRKHSSKKKVRLDRISTNHEKFIEPFNELGNVEEVKGAEEWKLHQRAFDGTWSQSDKDRIFEEISRNGFFKDSIPLHGVRLNFRPVLKKFWVKTKYGDIQEYFAPNKMSIRNSIYLRNDVESIREVD